MTVEAPRRHGREIPVYEFNSGALVDAPELPLLIEAAAATYVNLKVVARQGESYSSIETAVRRIGEQLPQTTAETSKPQTVPEGQVYIALQTLSLRVEQASLSRFWAEVNQQRQSTV